MAALVVVTLATFVAEQVAGEATRGAETIKTLVESGEWRRVFDAHPRIAPVGHWIERQFDLPTMVNNATSWLTGATASFVHPGNRS